MPPYIGCLVVISLDDFAVSSDVHRSARGPGRERRGCTAHRGRDPAHARHDRHRSAGARLAVATGGGARGAPRGIPQHGARGGPRARDGPRARRPSRRRDVRHEPSPGAAAERHRSRRRADAGRLLARADRGPPDPRARRDRPGRGERERDRRSPRCGRCLDRMRNARSEDERIGFDAEFHAQVGAASGNATLASMLNAVSSRTIRVRAWRGSLEEGAGARTVVQHAGHPRGAGGGAIRVVPSAAALVHVATTEAWFRSAVGRLAAGARSTSAPAQRASRSVAPA